MKQQENNEPTIHDKYRKFILQSKSNYLNGIEYSDVMEILRWCEKKINNQIPINVSCSTCVIDLIKMFANFE
jgi:hypothetical protein